MFQPVVVGRGHGAPIYAAVCNETHVFTSSGDRYVARWVLETGVQDGFTIQLDSPAYTLACQDETLFIGSTNGTLTAIDTQKKKILWESNLFGNAWMSTTVSPENGYLLAGDSEGNLLVVHANSGKKIIHFPFACGKIRQIHIMNQRILLATQTQGIIVLDWNTFNELGRFQPHTDAVNVLTSDHKYCFSGGKDGHLAISVPETQEVLKQIPIHYQAIYGLIRVADTWVSCSMDKTIKIWDHHWKIMQRLEGKPEGHKRSVNGLVKLSGNRFLSFSDDKTWMLWEQKVPIMNWSEN